MCVFNASHNQLHVLGLLLQHMTPEGCL